MRSNRYGFTLIEVLIVIVILGVLAGLAIPAYQSNVEKSRKSEALGVLAAMRAAELRYYAQNSQFSPAAGFCDDDPRFQALDFDCRISSLSRGGQRLHFQYGVAQNIALNPVTKFPTRSDGSILLFASRNTIDNPNPGSGSYVFMDEKGRVGGLGNFA